MGLVVGTNSWVTVAEADSYLADKFGASAWSGLANSIKEQSLITAFWWIYNNPNYNIAKSSTAEKVKNAQIELAWWIYNYYEEYRKREALISSGVKKFRIGEFSEDLNNQSLPKIVTDMLEDELTNLGGSFPTVSRDFSNNGSV